MAWTTPRTWALGGLVTSTIMNTHLRDNLNALYQRPMATAFFLPTATIGTTGEAWVTADAANIAVALTPNTTRVVVYASMEVAVNQSNSGAGWTLSDGTTRLGDSVYGLVGTPGNVTRNVTLNGVFTGLATGVNHTFTVQFRAKVAATTSAAIVSGFPVTMVAHEI